MGITGTLQVHEINKLKLKPSTMIETGTGDCNSILNVAGEFQQCFTIDNNLDVYLKAIHTCVDVDNIKCIYGNSTSVLPTILNELNVDERCLFFLDAHTFPEKVPILEELAVILTQRKGGDVFMIDDVRLFSNASDWMHISFGTILDCFKAANVKVIDTDVYRDRFIIYT